MADFKLMFSSNFELMPMLALYRRHGGGMVVLVFAPKPVTF